MAINFPDSPTNGQVFTSGSTSWTYDGTKWNLNTNVAVSNDSLPVGAIMWFGNTTTTPPGYIAADGSAVSRTTYATLFAVIGTTHGSGDGSTTFNVPNVASTTGKYFIRYTTSLGTQTTTSLSTAPVGTMIDWPVTSSYPTGWLRADGSAVSRTSYADLFALISTTYGTGDGSTTFNLPNMVSAGSGSPVGIIKASLGGIVEPSTVAHASSHTEGGSDVVSVTLNQVPSYQSSRNRIINGNFDVWQRPFSASNYITVNTTNNTFGPDRWLVYFDGTMGNNSLNQMSFTLGQTSIPGEPKYHLRWDITSAGSASTYRELAQRIEGVRTFAGQTVTLSFWAKADAARTITLTLRQNFGTGGSPSSDVNTALTSISATTSWQKFTRTVTLPSISGKTIGTNNNDYLQLIFGMPINVVMQFDLSQVQLEAGSTATPFEFEPYETTLRKCQRYYYKWPLFSGSGYGSIGIASTQTTTAGRLHVQFPVPMRIAPTGLVASGSSFVGWVSGGGGVSVTLGQDRFTDTSALVAVTGTSFTSGGAVMVSGASDGTSKVEFTGAEL